MTPHRSARSAKAPTAETLLARQGGRPTRARVHALAVLLAAREALSHHEVERRLARSGAVDRVTLYRALEWLTEQGLAHKVAGDDRVWRFSAAGNDHPGGAAHAHFRCSECGKTICLDEAAWPAIPLPRGFRRTEVEVTVKGSCDACTL